MKLLVIAEHNNQTLKESTLKTISAARAIGDDITVLVIGYQCQTVAETCQNLQGVKQVIQVDAESYTHFLAENMSLLIVEIAKGYSHILAPATTFGKNLMPRVAALLDVAQISEITQVIDADTFVRPIYAGNAFATVRSRDPIKVITVRQTAFASTPKSTAASSLESLSLEIENSTATFIKQDVSETGRPDLSAARVVISGGRGLQNGENFKLLEALADRLNAAIGASRAAVDAGFVPNDYQVGQTGKVIAPELYIAVGISGAIQHLAGMKDSKVIVAINKDPDAPIFKVADYGLVGDLFQIIPELTAALDRNKS